MITIWCIETSLAYFFAYDIKVKEWIIVSMEEGDTGYRLAC